MNNLTGTELGAFKILELIGSGGMGVIYKACYKTAENKFRAIKVIRPEYASDKGFIARFQQEEQLLVDLVHPNIVRGYHFDEDKGKHYLVMEYIEGESLRARLRREKRLSIPDTIRLAEQLSSALAHAHGMEEPIIHRDIKPDNILLRKSDSAALLTDFGLMEVLGEKSYLQSSLHIPDSCVSDSVDIPGSCLSSGPSAEDGKKGTTSGTLAYMAPEQVKGGEGDAKSDIYQFGAVLYECLTGQLPLGRFVDPSKHNPQVPKSLEELILKCLEPLPVDRFQSISSLKKNLAGISKSFPGVKPGPENAASEFPGMRETTAESEAIKENSLQSETNPQPNNMGGVTDTLQRPGLEADPKKEKTSAARLVIPDISAIDPSVRKMAGSVMPESNRRRLLILGAVLIGLLSWFLFTKIKERQLESQRNLSSKAEAKVADEARVAVEAGRNKAFNGPYSGLDMTWFVSGDFCRRNGGRLPTIDELKNMNAECAVGKQSYGCNLWFWSSEEINANTAYVVAFPSGNEFSNSKGVRNHVRCVP